MKSMPSAAIFLSTAWRKVLFSQTCVIHSVHRGKGWVGGAWSEVGRGGIEGVCSVAPTFPHPQ